MDSNASGQSEPVLPAWDPRRYVRKIDPSEVRLSRGFMRCRPEKWFPGFSAHWLPLAHSLGLEVRVVECKPVAVTPKGLDVSFTGSVDNEPMAILMDAESRKIAVEAVSPGATENAKIVTLEYLARRLLSTLALSWSGPQPSVVRFDPDRDPSEAREAGAIKLTVMINNNPCTVWLVLGRLLVDKFDGLWRRQIQSASKLPQGNTELRLEIAQLAVPPSMLVDYMAAGTVVDLEVLISDLVTIRAGNKPWLPGRICDVGGKLGFEIVAGPTSAHSLPEGTTRLSIEFGKVSFDSTTMAEMGQVGAIYETDLPLTENVVMVINGERVADATLCSYEGRFAISVR